MGLSLVNSVSRGRRGQISGSPRCGGALLTFLGLLNSACWEAESATQRWALSEQAVLVLETGGASSRPPITEASLFDELSTSGLEPRDGTIWSSRLIDPLTAEIEICWARSALYGRTVDGRRISPTPGVATLMTWVMDAVTNTWSRYAGIYWYIQALDGTWWPCWDEHQPNQLVVGFAEQPLADYGSSSASPTRVLLPSNLTSREEVGRAAFDLFGRALRLVDPGDPYPIAPQAKFFLRAQMQHGMKPPRTLVDANGSCLQAMRESGLSQLMPTMCNQGAYTASWHPVERGGATLLAHNVKTERCLLTFGSNAASLLIDSCDRTTRATTDIERAQWRAAGALCVSVDAAEANAPLVLVECSTTSTRWDFDLGASGQIRLSSAGSCLAAAPADESPNAALVLVDCSRSESVASFARSRLIEFSAQRCAATRTSSTGRTTLQTSDCNTAGVDSYFNLSWQLTSNGACASMPSDLDPGSWMLAVSAPCAPTIDESAMFGPNATVWDYYW